MSHQALSELQVIPQGQTIQGEYFRTEIMAGSFTASHDLKDVQEKIALCDHYPTVISRKPCCKNKRQSITIKVETIKNRNVYI